MSEEICCRECRYATPFDKTDEGTITASWRRATRHVRVHHPYHEPLSELWVRTLAGPATEQGGQDA